eukprot:m.64384 g.64384  ORF g.64384 m.64384 type:complete len:400 (+) comp49710_c0_seq3:138-1337(+)
MAVFITRAFACRFSGCSAFLESKEALCTHIHLHMAVGQDSPFPRYCRFNGCHATLHEDELDAHLAAHLEKLPSQSVTGVPCSFSCGEWFTSYFNLEAHIALVHPQRDEDRKHPAEEGVEDSAFKPRRPRRACAPLILDEEHLAHSASVSRLHYRSSSAELPSIKSAIPPAATETTADLSAPTPPMPVKLEVRSVLDLGMTGARLSSTQGGRSDQPLSQDKLLFEPKIQIQYQPSSSAGSPTFEPERAPPAQPKRAKERRSKTNSQCQVKSTSPFPETIERAVRASPELPKQRLVCPKCEHDVFADTNSTECARCQQTFHDACVGRSRLTERRPIWTCSACKKAFKALQDTGKLEDTFNILSLLPSAFYLEVEDGELVPRIVEHARKTSEWTLGRTSDSF